MSRYVLYMLGLIMGIHCIVSVIKVAAESPACEDAFEVYLVVKQVPQVSWFLVGDCLLQRTGVFILAWFLVADI